MNIFKAFTTNDIVVASPSEVTVGMWTGDTGSLTAFYTSAYQDSSSISGQYYTNVYQLPTSSDISAVQFDIAYGNRLGGGAPTLTQDETATLSTTAIYSQYRNLLLEAGDLQFTFDGNWNSDHIYVINISRAQVKETLDPGNWLISLSGSTGVSTFIDDSGQTLGATYGKSGRVFNIVSGSLTGISGSTVYSTTSSTQGGYGLVYPDLGYMIWNPDALAQTIGTTILPSTGSSSTHQYNHRKFYQAMVLGAEFEARSAETISSTHYFVRIMNQEFNYSNNPTFYDPITGAIVNRDFINNPVTYITSIGLYNANNELVAVAKLSAPYAKSFTSEANIKVRLDF